MHGIVPTHARPHDDYGDLVLGVVHYGLRELLGVDVGVGLVADHPATNNYLAVQGTAQTSNFKLRTRRVEWSGVEPTGAMHREFITFHSKVRNFERETSEHTSI